jgi:hypothetical protein
MIGQRAIALGRQVQEAASMRTSMVASMGTTFTHRDEVRAAPAASRPAAQSEQSQPRPGRRRVTQFLKRS